MRAVVLHRQASSRCRERRKLSTNPQTCDVFILGGGPAGSTAAALLAQRGHDVVIVEKDRHPRFHIGESLLPLNLPLIEKLGLSEKIRAIGMTKYGAELVSPQDATPVTLDFSFAWDKSHPYAYQVRRSQFDQILFEECVRNGARAFQECRVSAVDLGAQAVRGTPIYWSLRAFKTVYYINGLLDLRSNAAAWLQRRRAVRAALADTSARV